MILLPTHTGKCIVKIKIGDISPMFNLEWVAKLVIFDKEQEIQILSMAKEKGEFWSRKHLKGGLGMP